MEVIYSLLVQVLHTDLSRSGNRVARHDISVRLGARVQVLNKQCSFCNSGIKTQNQQQLPSLTETLGVFISADF